MKNLLNKNKTQKLTNFVRAIKNCFAGHMQPAGRGLPTPGIEIYIRDKRVKQSYKIMIL
jgi:hypothetical protein